MTEKIKQLQALAELKFEFKSAKLNLLEKVDSAITITYNGGLFKATQELISYLGVYLMDHGPCTDHKIVLLDEYENPIEINPSELKYLLYEAHQYALNAYLTEFNELKKVRKGDKL